MSQSPRAAMESFELTLLLRLGDVLAQRGTTAKHILQRCLHEIADCCRADRVVLATQHADACARVDVAIGLTPAQIQRSHYRSGEGVVGRVITTGEPAPTESMHGAHAGVDGAWPEVDGVLSPHLCVPIFGRASGVIGALGVDRCRPEAPWMQDDLRLLTVLAGLMSSCVTSLRAAYESEQKRVHVFHRSAPPGPSIGASQIVGESAQTQHLLESVARAAASDSVLLIQGERGVGKALAVREVHARSRRRDQPLVRVSCAAFGSSTSEGDLFGHGKGTSSGAGPMRRGSFGHAEGGTIFLDEIDALPMPLQSRLLRMIRQRTLSPVAGDELRSTARIVASTHVDLASAVRARTFREDLYLELITTQITIPPLRERKSDIAVLARHFCEVLCHTHRCPLRQLSPDAMAALMNHDWPGNVRELESAILRAVLLARGRQIVVDDLPAEVRPHDLGAHCVTNSLEQRISDFERATILDAMREAGGSHTRAARALQTTPRILAHRLRRLGAAANDR